MYKGYADDPRNTDNAWIETRAVNYHDEDGHILRNFTIQVNANIVSYLLPFYERSQGSWVNSNLLKYLPLLQHACIVILILFIQSYMG